MEIDEMEIVELELKYCERCGALWLRACGLVGVYCTGCVTKMLDLPVLRKSRAARRRPVNDDLRRVEFDERPVLATEGGTA